MARPVLKFKNILKFYNRNLPNQVDVLKGVDFSLNAGEMVGLIAPSGSGKTTMLNIAGLLDSPSSGTIEINGSKVFHMEDESKRQIKLLDKLATNLRRDLIGFVYQFHHLLPEFTALENVELPKLLVGKSSRQAKTEAEELLYSVGLENRLLHKPSQLSGGEQQRVAICRALANNPKILLADEPTGNLDSDTSKEVFSILTETVKRNGMAAIIATHNTEFASKLDRIIRIESGKLV
ncbi:MAG: ABC transporter ATP-binding protein [Paracoccaceae bacterium]